MTQSSRRNFLKTSAVGAATFSATTALAQNTNLSQKTIAEVESLEAKRDADTTANWNDGLVHPAPYKNPFAQGKERGVALGGGGTPLATGFATVNEMALTIRRKGMTPLIVVMTDGVANVTLEGVGGRERAHQDALQTARQLRTAGHAILFIDTASAPQALAEALANEMAAQYLPLPYINSGKAISQRAAHLAQQ